MSFKYVKKLAMTSGNRHVGAHDYRGMRHVAIAT